VDTGKQEIMEFIAWLVAVYAAICVAAYFGNRDFRFKLQRSTMSL